MLRIIKHKNNNARPISVEFEVGEDYFHPGQIAGERNINPNKTTYGVFGPLTGFGIGVIDDCRDISLGIDTTVASNRITVWIKDIEFETDKFDGTVQYKAGENLYGTIDGLWGTALSKTRRDLIVIGRCLGVPTATHACLTVESLFGTLLANSNAIISGGNIITRKINQGVARCIKCGLENEYQVDGYTCWGCK